MALLWHIDACIPLAEVHLCIAGKMPDALTNQATPPHEQPGADYANHEHHEDEQRQLEENLQGSLHLSEQYFLSTLLNL